MELTFRLEFNEQYLLVLDEAVETSVTISNYAVFDPIQQTIDVDEIEVPSGKLYSAQLRLVSSENEFVFATADARAYSSCA
jgi:hypothetical protein